MGLVSNDSLRLRGAMLLPGARDDEFRFLADGVVVTDGRGVVTFIGPATAFPGDGQGFDRVGGERGGVLIPPLVDCHIHIPQHPIRGRFVEGVTDALAAEQGGRLLAGLGRNVFPAEGRCADLEYTAEVVRTFLAETSANGTVGGVAYMTSHPIAARAALEILPESWRVGLVLMDMNCPVGLQISVGEAATAMTGLAREFGDRLVITDRFAVACSTALRAAGVEAADKFGLDSQTHLAEQPGELAVIKSLYPASPHYTGVYESDGLLGRDGQTRSSILAHCIHMSDAEWEILARRHSRVAHCPVSNTELGSGVMHLDKVYEYGLDWALCTDVGASPSTSLLVEGGHFLNVHAGRTSRATAQTALWRATIGAKRVGRVRAGGLAVSEQFSGVEILTHGPVNGTAEEVVRKFVLPAGETMDHLQRAVLGRVGRVWG